MPGGEPFADLLGLEVVEVGPGAATVRGTVGSEHLNAHGIGHGGFVFALADHALAMASNSHGPAAVALVATIHFTRRVRAGETLVARAREVSLGRSAATYEVTVETDGGRTVALFTGTVHRLPDA
ncbi:MAG: hydroxyphenylacetyl-CoA thioesterase PaaI [Actinobacteria bacterium]|nr:MAG: hydroxyphenylacetyl-CoA thioesterase PaaI [Actinomycetota bacterium]